MILLLSYILVASAAIGITLALSGGTHRESKMDQVAELITERFICEVDQTKMEDAASAAMIASLGDRWSYYIPASEYEDYHESTMNAYVGIGITISEAEDGSGMLVETVQENGPAARAGMLPGDIIVSIDEHSTVGISPAEARELVRGEVGTSIPITVLRMGEGITLYVTREQVNTIVAKGEILEEGIGLISIENFDSRCAEETLGAIETLLEQGAKTLIFDVRNNPGGYANELVEILDYLLPEGDLFRTVDYEGNEHTDRSDAACLNVPMAVLVNGNSYSAAEFFAAALRDYDAAVIFGEQTCGKGYFQMVYQLDDGSAVGLSVGKYFTPKGESLAGVGVTPDFEVAVDDETAAGIYYGTLEPEEDPQLAAAWKYMQDVIRMKNS